MLTIDDRLQKMIDLSSDIMRFSRNSLLVNLRFMDSALSRLTQVAVYEDMIVETYSYEGEEDVHIGNVFSLCKQATDGHFLVYSPVYILNSYRKEKKQPARNMLHSVMHCVFRHMYIHSMVHQRCWNLACDIAVENAITDLHVDAVHCEREDRQRFVINGLRRDVGFITAEKLYRYFIDKQLSDERMTELEELFKADDHDLWYLPPVIKKTVTGVLDKNAGTQTEHHKKRRNADRSSQTDDGEQGDSQQNGGQEQQGDSQQNGEQDQQDDGSGKPEKSDSEKTNNGGEETGYSAADAEKDWEEVSQRMQTDLETFHKSRGDAAGDMLQNLKEVNREKYDYTEFLKKFSVLGEVMKINDDEFDYIYYTYGLQLYENMPLIEPLEYKEVKRIREFVIAIDTSGSVSGEQVQSFINKTYNIMKSTESFFSKVNIHIIQCDTEVQEHVKITSQEEFDAYIKRMKLRGFGGTDFRPVFSMVEELRKNKEFSNLKGLIYFTDGYGVFPENKPPYETAFVFVQDGYDIPEVPPWAIKLVLQKEDI